MSIVEFPLMLQVCGITIGNELNFLTIDEGLVDAATFLLLEDSDVLYLSKSASKRIAPLVSFHLSGVKLKSLLALKCWINEHVRAGDVVDNLLSADFNVMTRNAYINKLHQMSNKEAPKVTLPSSYKDNWVDFDTSMIEYFKAHTSTNGIGMHFYLRDDTRRPAPNVLATLSLDERAYWTTERARTANANLESVSTADRDWCWTILAAVTQDTQAWGWVKRFKRDQDFVGAWESLRSFYDGKAQRQKRVITAQKTLEDIHYKDEYSFSFSSFVTQLEASWETLEQAGISRTDEEKVSFLISRINTNNQKFNAAVENTANLHSDDFMDAITALSTSVTRNFPVKAKGTKRSVNSVERGNDDGRNSDSRFYCNGVHIDSSNWRNCITKENKEQIPFLVRKMISYCRDKDDFDPSQRSGRSKNRRRKGQGDDREISEITSTNNDSPPTNGDNNNNDDTNTENMSKDNQANQSGTKFGNRRK